MLSLGVCVVFEEMSWYAVSNWQRMWSGMESGSLCMTVTDQHSWKAIWCDCVWMATGRPGFNIVVVNQYPSIVLNSELPVAIHTQSQECWSVSVIHKLPNSTPDHIRCQFEAAYQLISSNMTHSWTQHSLTPPPPSPFHRCPSGTYSFK